MISIAALLLAASTAQTSGDVIFSDGFELATSLTRLTTSDVRYPNTGNSLRYDVDVTQYDNIWGHATNSDPVVPWPGRNGAVPTLLDFGKTEYICAQFHVPDDVAPGLYGALGYSTYYSGPALTLAYSQACGDFDPEIANCVSTVGTGEAFKKFVIAPHVNGCPLTPGSDYYANFKIAHPESQDCGGLDTCKLALYLILGSQ